MIPEKGKDYVFDAALNDLVIGDRGGVLNVGHTFSEAQLFATLSHNYLKDYVTKEDIIEISERFVALGFVKRHSDEFAGDYFELTEHAHNLFAEKIKDGPLANARKFGARWLADAIHNILSERDQIEPQVVTDDIASEIPAADRFVSVEHNQPEYADTLKAIDDFIEKAPTDNLFCDLVVSEDDRAVIMSEAITLKNLIEAPKVNPNTVTALGFGFLWLAENLAGGLIGELAAVIYKGVMALIG